MDCGIPKEDAIEFVQIYCRPNQDLSFYMTLHLPRLSNLHNPSVIMYTTIMCSMPSVI